MNRALSLALVLSAACVPAASQTCIVFIPPEKRIAERIADRTIVAAAQVEIIDARALRKAEGDMRPWQARARVLAPAKGHKLPATVRFERGWGSAACEWGAPPVPRPGDRWIVYFWASGGPGVRKPWLAISLAEADKFDPDWRKRIR